VTHPVRRRAGVLQQADRRPPLGRHGVIVLLIFGVGRVGKIGGELGKGIKEFRKGLQGDENKPPESQDASTKPPEGGAAA